MSTQQYCLRWNNHQPNFIAVFSSLLNSESLVDVTLAAEGRHLQAHKVVLSACSTYFQSLFTINPCQHPIVILKDVKFLDLKVIIDFMYYGEVNVSQGQLPHVLKTAAMLKIKGLADIPVEQQMIRPENNYLERAELLPPNDSNWCSEGLPRQTMSPSPCPVSPPNRRKRLRKISTSSVSGLTEKTEENQTIIDTLNASTCHMGTVIRSDNVIEKKHVIDGDKGNNHQLLDEKVGTMVSQNMNLQHTAENLTSPNVTGSTSGHNVADKPKIVTTLAQTFQQTIEKESMGTKRGRFLMRQERLKCEHEPIQPSASDGDMHYLTVPNIRVERQCSDPLPDISPPAASSLTDPSLSLVKQHSHPLLQSQISELMSPPLVNVQTIHTSHAAEMAENRTLSPIVVITDPPPAPVHDIIRRANSSLAPLPTPTGSLRVKTEELKKTISSLQGTRSSHCPVVRHGPALGCNYCWNTIDTHGRILRRKTKYHCPECQTNLCIVPCFQEYHERQEAEAQDAVAPTTSVMRIYPRNTLM